MDKNKYENHLPKKSNKKTKRKQRLCFTLDCKSKVSKINVRVKTIPYQIVRLMNAAIRGPINAGFGGPHTSMYGPVRLLKIFPFPS